MNNTFEYEVKWSNDHDCFLIRKYGTQNDGKRYHSASAVASFAISLMAEKGLTFDKVLINKDVLEKKSFNHVYCDKVGYFVASKLGLREQGEKPVEENLEAEVTASQ